MSAYSVSSRLGAALALVLCLVSALPAAARVHVKGHLTDDDGRDVKVQINGKGVTITPSDSITVGDHDAIVVDDGAGMVRLFSDATVRRGEHIDGDVVAVFGDVHVSGDASGSAVAVFGSVHVDSSASVTGDAVAVGGKLEADEGSHIGGQSVSIGFLPITYGLPAVPLMLMVIGLGWLVTVFLSFVFSALMPGRFARVAVTASHRTAASLAIGILSGPLVPVVAVLLMVTVIGLPIGLLLPIAWAGASIAGYFAATHVLGAKLLRRRPGEGGLLAPVIAGATLIAAFFLFGTSLWMVGGVLRTVALFFVFTGLLIMLGLSAIGSGAVLLSRLGTRPRDLGDIADAPPAPMPPPAPAPTPAPEAPASVG